ncbi:MAG TPA: helix-turn-helix transcriptional regulator [Polyangiales bacterium]|nr:helix-turn-helix transcriptional regulator [Polyangiales bacterium]
MQLRTHTPGPPLARHVEYLWHLRDVPGHAAERVLPSGTLELVINLAQDAFHVHTAAGSRQLRGAIVSGVYTRFFSIDTRDHADVLGVHFRPGGAWPVLGVAPGALADQHCELEDLWGRTNVRRLREQLWATPARERLSVFEAALAARCADSWQLHSACSQALDALACGARVTQVAAAAGLTSRRLQAVFQQQVGTAPKLFARLCRFQRALGDLERTETPDWPELAQASGYFDQSHLIREFRAIAGCAPTELTRARHVPVKEHHLALPGSSDSSNTQKPTGAR